MSERRTARTILPDDPFGPAHAVWELTMRCDHACAHCGSRAVRPRPNELDTDELLEVARALVRNECREVALIGGEAYLHPGFLTIVAYLANNGVRVVMQTGGRGVTAELAKACKTAGMAAIGVSIDGPEAIHDELRASRGSFRSAIRALENAREAGLITSSNMQINRLNKDHLRETLAAVLPTGIVTWRAQMTAPMGRAADRPDWILQPYEILEVLDTLAAMQIELAEVASSKGLDPSEFFDVQVGNNIGYFGPHEQILRTQPGEPMTWYSGCQAGRHVLGIESNGDVKGCPSLPSGPYVGGNIREMSLEDLWETPELSFARSARSDELWGFCKTCMYAEVCQAGCSFQTTTAFGRRGNNPWCYHRARTLKKEGIRERVVQRERAPGLPYDFGRFEIVQEPW